MGELNKLLDGNWYSTRSEGECKEPGQTIGKDCWWRQVAKTAQRNSTCVNGRVSDAVIRRRPECFQKCGPGQADNQTSPCWVSCFFDTLVGNSDQNVTGMTRDEILEPFSLAFASTDPKKGGCPEVPDCPPPCNPPM